MNPTSGEDRLDEALRRLRRTRLSASPGTAALVLGAFRAHHERRRRRRVAILTSIAATLVFVFIAAKLLRPTAVPNTAEAHFIALPYGESGVPLEEGVVIRLDLPAADLAQFGVPPSLRPKSKRVHAEFLIGQDGMARAVRFLPTQKTNSFKE
ncbi:MAG: hypothetical protein JO033_10865 [Acidobacteriaceae bacterium]|nr:hypothetical protein [Acidobacteriaceae bacterium]MBV9502769.1 hypothetical protein [Acidobacteriaceae bacterium]